MRDSGMDEEEMIEQMGRGSMEREEKMVHGRKGEGEREGNKRMERKGKRRYHQRHLPNV
jgi:hypothetical protein